MVRRSFVLVSLLSFAVLSAHAAAELEITPVMQAEIDRQTTALAELAKDPLLVGAVKTQNSKGPLDGMDNAKWKATKRTDPLVKEFQNTDAARLLQKKLADSNGLFTEAFLNASQGEKVAFVEKTSNYTHKGSPKFDVPMTGKAWQGKPEFDESTQTYAVQVSVPIVENGSPIGALVVGVALESLQKKK